jgi:hypothetical protein
MLRLPGVSRRVHERVAQRRMLVQLRVAAQATEGEGGLVFHAVVDPAGGLVDLVDVHAKAWPVHYQSRPLDYTLCSSVVSIKSLSIKRITARWRSGDRGAEVPCGPPGSQHPAAVRPAHRSAPFTTPVTALVVTG